MAIAPSRELRELLFEHLLYFISAQVAMAIAPSRELRVTDDDFTIVRTSDVAMAIAPSRELRDHAH